MKLTPRSDRILGIGLGAAMVLAAIAVAVFAGRGGPGASVAVNGDGPRTISVQLADMQITPSSVTVPSGTHVVLEVSNTDQLSHDLYLDGGPRTPLLRPGRSARLDLGAVTRTMHGWCTVPGHKAAGMVMTIKVTGSPASSSSASDSGMAMGGSTAGTSPAIDFTATPGPDWRPYNPRLAPVAGGRTHSVTFTVTDTRTEVAPGVRQTLWTYNGTAPGPMLHGRVGDAFIVTIVNKGNMPHSIDFHAGAVAPDGAMRSIDPGRSLTYGFTAKYSGAWLYHCSTMPMSLHIANGMYGAVIVDPPDLDRVARQFVFVQSELYLGSQDGVADERKINAKQPDAVMFNGYVNQYVDAPITVRAGERIRVWVVDAGPEFGTSFHVVGTQFDTVFKEGAYLLRPNNPEHGAAQSLDLAPAQGGFVEFTLVAPGHYSFLDHAMVDAEHGARGIFLVR